ncbi:MAG TPA: hypothetical protein VFD52_06105 [Clostridia bacterium]|nr:hypothetical protein [Clostridia bacterium]
MDSISLMPEEIVTWLNEQEILSDINFMTEFPPTSKAIPLKNTVVAVGIEKVKIEDKFTTDEETGKPVEEEYCRLATIKIRLSIHVPFTLGGAMCHENFTRIVDCLTFATDLNILDSGCNCVQADRNTDALVLSGWINILADFCPAESTGINFASFINKELLCGSHINNPELHVTQAEKSLWNDPISSGYYLGNGSNSRTITLGFQPKLVVVCALEHPVITIDFTNSSSKSYCAVANRTYNSMGMVITSNGFKLLQGSSYVLDGCSPCLNELGETYFYTAFK